MTRPNRGDAASQLAVALASTPALIIAHPGPLAGWLDRLPAAQRAALLTSFGIGPPDPAAGPGGEAEQVDQLLAEAVARLMHPANRRMLTT